MEKSWQNQFHLDYNYFSDCIFSSILSENRNNEVEIEYTEYKSYLDEGAIKKAIIIIKLFGEI